MRIAGKKVLITGGTKGIGAAVAIDLAAVGAFVAINGRHNDAEAQKVVADTAHGDWSGALLTADVSREEDVEQMVAEAVEQLGGLDIVVHSAGGPAGGSIDELDSTRWREAFDVHVHSTFYLAKAALPHLRKSGESSFILVSSVAGIRGIPGALAYGTVKGAVAQFTRMLAREEADNNVRVNCVAPGIIRTRFHESMTDEQREHNLSVRIPLHREGKPEDVAQMVRSLIANDFMTGEVVTIDGGMTMQISR